MPAKKKPPTHGPTFNIKGGVHAGRDVIMGDQYNRIFQKVEQNPSPAEFAAALRAAREEIDAQKQQPGLTSAQVRNLEIASVKVLEAADKPGQPEPPVDEIKAALSEAKETMDLLSGSLLSAVNLGALLGNLILLAGRVFGVF